MGHIYRVGCCPHNNVTASTCNIKSAKVHTFCTDCNQSIKFCFWGYEPFDDLRDLCGKTDPIIKIHGVDYGVFKGCLEDKGKGNIFVKVTFIRMQYLDDKTPTNPW